MTKKTKRRRSKKRRPDFFEKNRFWLILMGIAGLVVVSLVMFARMEEKAVPPALPPIAKPVPKPVVDYTQDVHAEVEALLATIPGASIQREFDLSPARYEVDGQIPSTELLTAFQQRLGQIPGNYSARIREANSLVVEKARQPLIIVHFVPRAVDLPEGPLVAIIMDDLGRSVYTAQELISIPQKVTFSILPIEPHAAEVAELAYQANHEVMLHVPMEPQGYPAVNPGQDALFVSYSDDEISRRFDAHLAAIPHVVGTNNHMGSRFTEDARALAPVMKSLKERGMYFIDSRTTGHSRVTEVAQKYHVPTMDRDVFLDNVAEVQAISVQIGKLEKKARKMGMAIGICHPYPETIEALRRELPELANRGINFVPVSTLLLKQASTQGS